MTALALAGAFAAALAEPAAAPPMPDDLALFEEIRVASWWAQCCGVFFPNGLPSALEGRLARVQARLEARYGKDAVTRATEESRAGFEQELGLYDPAAQRDTFEERMEKKRVAYNWYAAQLGKLERRLRSMH
jgi:hypothetical protein